MKIGDKVVLKSGGPTMTVKSVNDDFARCQWFDKNQELKEGGFPCDALELAKDRPSPYVAV